MSRRTPTLVLVAAALAALCLAPVPSTALSWPLCDNGGQVWVTERPRTQAQFPGANLWFFCEGQLQILGKSVSTCVASSIPNAPPVCLPQMADAICQLLGYEQAFAEDTETVTAAPDEPVITLKGDYCLRKGQFSSTLPENLGSLPGEPCDKIQKLTCIRTLDTMAAAATLGLMDLGALQATPAAEDLQSTARVAENQAVATFGGGAAGGGGGGRKLAL